MWSKVSNFIPNYNSPRIMSHQIDKNTTPSALCADETGVETDQKGFWTRAWEMYRDGFKNLSKTGRQLWLLVLIKLFIMFAILKAFLFPNFLRQNTDGTDEAKGEYVTEQFVDRALK